MINQLTKPLQTAKQGWENLLWWRGIRWGAGADSQQHYRCYNMWAAERTGQKCLFFYISDLRSLIQSLSSPVTVGLHELASSQVVVSSVFVWTNNIHTNTEKPLWKSVLMCREERAGHVYRVQYDTTRAKITSFWMCTNAPQCYAQRTWRSHSQLRRSKTNWKLWNSSSKTTLNEELKTVCFLPERAV